MKFAKSYTWNVVGMAASLSLAGCTFDVTQQGEAEPTRSQGNAITYGELDGTRHPEVVSLELQNSSGDTVGFCSGVTVSERYVITAGHCVDSLIGFPTTSDGTMSLRVKFAQDGESPTTVYSGLVAVALHPLYLSSWLSGPGSYEEYDLALIKLGLDATSFKRARLQAFNAIMPNRQEIVGWGAHWYETVEAGTLRMMGITDLERWGGNGFINLKNDPAWTNGGDSGGGYFVKPLASSDKRVLTGVHSAHGGSHMYGAMIALNLDFIFQQAEDWFRPLSCELSSLGNVLFFGSCKDSNPEF